MGEVSRFIEAAIITAVFAAAAMSMNYFANAGCDHKKPVTAMVDRGPPRVVLN